MTTLRTLDGTLLSRHAFGAMQFGGGADATDAAALFGACREAGINHFDTAVGYNDGAADQILGPLVAADRDAVFVASKVGYTGGTGAANLTAQFDRTRRNLGLDVIDLLYLHRFDPDTPLADTFATLAQWQADGAIRHIGVSNYAAWQVMKAQAICASLGTRIDVIQPMYNLVKRQAEVEILPMAMDQNILVCPYSPLGGGLLTGKYQRGEAGRLTEDDRYAERYAPEWMHTAAAGLHDIAAEVGTHPATLAVAWVAQHPAAPCPIISARNVDQIARSLAALGYTLDTDLYDRLSGLSPRPAPATDRLEET